jgi:hypothetical protein
MYIGSTVVCNDRPGREKDDSCCEVRFDDKGYVIPLRLFVPIELSAGDNFADIMGKSSNIFTERNLHENDLQPFTLSALAYRERSGLEIS